MALEDTESYKTAHSTYIASVAVAERTTDNTAKLTAELEWERTQRRLEKEFAEGEAREEKLKAVHEQIKKDYPAVPESLLTSVSDPDKLLALAKEIQASIGSGDWGAPSGAPGGGGAKNTKLKDENDLRDRVNKGDTQANSQFRKGIIAEKVLPFIEEQRGGARPARTT